MEVTRKKQCDKMMACHLEMDRVVYAVEKIQILGVVRAEGAGAPHKTLDAQGITGEFFFLYLRFSYQVVTHHVSIFSYVCTFFCDLAMEIIILLLIQLRRLIWYLSHCFYQRQQFKPSQSVQ
jgi:hypothetical protein